MAKASSRTTTVSVPMSGPDLELTPEKYEYVGPNKIRITCRTELGDLMVVVMTTAAVIASIKMADALMESHFAQVFKDLNVF